MVAAHHVADDLRALAVLHVRREVLLPHREEDAALHRLETVADVRQRARGDDRQRVIEIARLRRVVQRDVGGAAGSGTAEQRAANDGVASGVRLHGVDPVEERSIRRFASFGQSSIILAHGFNMVRGF